MPYEINTPSKKIRAEDSTNSKFDMNIGPGIKFDEITKWLRDP